MTRLVFWDKVLISAIIGILSYWVMGVIEKLLCPYKRRKPQDWVDDVKEIYRGLWK